MPKNAAEIHAAVEQRFAQVARSSGQEKKFPVGPASAKKVVGVDLCPEMVEKARRSAGLLDLRNVEFVQARIEKLPLPDASVDVAISIGVFNLCPDKPAVLAEAFRVLRPGGRLQMADILLHDDVTPEEDASKGEWSD